MFLINAAWSIRSVNDGLPKDAQRMGSPYVVTLTPAAMGELSGAEVRVTDLKRHVLLAREWISTGVSSSYSKDQIQHVLNRAAEKAEQQVERFVIAMPLLDHGIAPDLAVRL